MKHLSTLLKINPHYATSPAPLFISSSPFSVSGVLEAKDTTLNLHHQHQRHHLWSVAKTVALSVRQLQTLTAGNSNSRNSFSNDFTYSFFPTLFFCVKSRHRPWAPPGRDLQWISHHKTGEKYFLQTQTVCRMMQADGEGVGWCTWARETLQAAGVNLCYSRLHRESVVTLQGTMLRVGTKRVLICGLKKPGKSDS